MDYGLCLMWPPRKTSAGAFPALVDSDKPFDYERLQLNGTLEGFRGRTSHHNVIIGIPLDMKRTAAQYDIVLPRSARPVNAAATLVAQAPVPQASVSPQPRSNTRISMASLPTWANSTLVFLKGTLNDFRNMRRFDSGSSGCRRHFIARAN